MAKRRPRIRQRVVRNEAFPSDTDGEASLFERFIAKGWTIATAILGMGTALVFMTMEVMEWKIELETTLSANHAKADERFGQLAEAQATTQRAVDELLKAQTRAQRARDSLIGVQAERRRLCKSGVKLPGDLCDRVASPGALEVLSGESDSGEGNP